MRLLDKIALNRLIAIITSFILGILKLIPNDTKPNDVPAPPRFPLFKRRKKKQ